MTVNGKELQRITHDNILDTPMGMLLMIIRQGRHSHI